ncbi:MAG UNVERIFIED_CONTAM: hypothetical protein LOD86_05720 [Thermobifida fusca]|jgi:hypothetical protein
MERIRIVMPGPVTVVGVVRAMLPVVIACALLAACGKRTPPAAPDPEPTRLREVAAEPVDCDAYAARGLLVQAESREAFRAALGEPDSVITATVPNRHDPAITDTVVALYYADLSAIIWKPGYEGARDLLEHVEVRDNRYLRWPSLGIGARARNIITALGPPKEQSPTQLVYECGPSEAVPEPLVFELRAGRVRRVVFNRYVD